MSEEGDGRGKLKVCYVCGRFALHVYGEVPKGLAMRNNAAGVTERSRKIGREGTSSGRGRLYRCCRL